jgi:hypothetical protein
MDDALYINVVGEWVYYLVDDHIYKTGTDGSDDMGNDGEQQIISAEDIGQNYISSMLVVDDWIYFAAPGQYEGGIFKIKTDGTGLEKLSNIGNDINGVVGGWLYYNVQSGAELDPLQKGIYRIKTDGTGAQLLINNSEFVTCVVEGDFIYYTSQGIYRIKTDGTESQPQMILSDTDYGISSLNISDDWIYFSTIKSDETESFETMGYGKVRTDGTEEQQLPTDGQDMSSANTLGDWIYYYSEEAIEDFKLYKMKTDGSEKQIVE